MSHSINEAPKAGETWDVGVFKNLVFLGAARDITQEKWFVFADPLGAPGHEMLIFSKDSWYSDLVEFRARRSSPANRSEV